MGEAAAKGAMKLAFDRFFPFNRTPSAVITRALDFSGGGLVRGVGKSVGAAADIRVSRKAVEAGVEGAVKKAFAPEQQRAISMAFGRGSLGAPLLYMGWKLRESGWLGLNPFTDEKGPPAMSGIRAETPSGRAVATETGEMSGSVRIGDTWYNLAAASPPVQIMSVGAYMFDQHRADESKFQKGANVLGGVVRMGSESPMLSGQMEIADLARGDLSNALERTGQRTLGSAVPTAVADVAGFLDPYQRETRGQGIGAAFRERIPGLRQTLPVERTPLGRKREQNPWAAINPGIGSEARIMNDPLAKELYLRQPTLGRPRQKEHESDKYYRGRAALAGKRINDALRELISAPDYRDASADQKETLMQREISRARTEAENSLKRQVGRGRFEIIFDPRERAARLEEALAEAGIHDFE
jgi:hypothetical protein